MMLKRRCRLFLIVVFTAFVYILLSNILKLIWPTWTTSLGEFPQNLFHHGLRREEVNRGIDDIQVVMKALTSKVNWTEDSVPVFVVEEHHDVLGYWFMSAESGILPKKGNTLLHIDGHADSAAPFLIDGFPLFRWPRTAQEIQSMMQRNDIFIMAAGVTGFIARFIWVWPSWDAANHQDEGLHQVWKVELGMMTVTEADRQADRVLCGCWQAVRDYSDRGCRRQDVSSDKDDPNPIPIVRSQCNISRAGTVEFVSEEKVQELLEEGNWVTKDENVILDIDEDFFGCESAVTPLLKSGVSLDFISKLSLITSSLFCAEDAEEETSADKFLYAIINLILKMKVSCLPEGKRVDGMEHCPTDSDIQTVLIRLLKEFRTILLQQPIGQALCEKNKLGQLLLLQGIVKLLVPLNVSQLLQVAETGICLHTSPRGVEFNLEEGLRVCQGYNLPNSTVVLFHSPSPKEFNIQITRLASIFSAFQSSAGSPDLVTVVRSVRDGYTPQNLFHQVETDVLRMLTQTFSGIEKSSIHFDTSLLGGKQGWPNRHRKELDAVVKTLEHMVFRKRMSNKN